VLYGERDSDAYGTYHMTLTHTCYPRSVVHSHLEMNCFSVLLISFTTVCLVIVILFALLLITVCCVAECFSILAAIAVHATMRVWPV